MLERQTATTFAAPPAILTALAVAHAVDPARTRNAAQVLTRPDMPTSYRVAGAFWLAGDANEKAEQAFFAALNGDTARLSLIPAAGEWLTLDVCPPHGKGRTWRIAATLYQHDVSTGHYYAYTSEDEALRVYAALGGYKTWYRPEGER